MGCGKSGSNPNEINPSSWCRAATAPTRQFRIDHFSKTRPFSFTPAKLAHGWFALRYIESAHVRARKQCCTAKGVVPPTKHHEV